MPTETKPAGSPLVEVWGDTANPRHLACAIVIGGALSLAAFAIASRILTELVRTPELARAYAMLAGLAGCVLAGFICACLFKPKRVVTEDISATGSVTAGAAREQALDRLAEESGGLGTMADLPAATVQELRELQLYELFAARERGATAAASQAEAAIPDAAAPVRPNAA
ncbi:MULTISPECIES: hypothetical protein [unclassified Cupriavidus]|uniref:hypothetical protein n=1 Tax=unclassified Cupriavidus TaxID=2640874 RepID=UPI000290FE0C|nr:MULTISPECIES: hypothetical protein [unclassified Cupriavidus]ESH86936.1 hypothetical protein B551_0224990 [Cupriavidus sp. HPC(L)]MCD9120905.1 hypothetical protein [Cupriavidus sp. UGS-1]